ncbi:MAG: thioether cross-link-forming SCIFF peptide maturase [Christensenellales bacterium]
MVHTFIYGGEYFALDVESGSVHVLDKPGFEAVSQLALAQASGENFKMALSEINEHLADEILKLMDDGMLFSAAEEDTSRPQSVVKAMCLHLAHDCNLACDYCFAKGGAFAGKREMMSAKIAKAAIDFLVEVSGTRRNLEIDFFGGEPLLNFGVLKQTVDYAQSVERELHKNFRFTVTTNGYHLTDEMIKYLNRYMSNIVVSIDGRPHVHDAVRKTAGGKGSYQRVTDNAKNLLLGRKGEYYVRGTFTADNLDFSRDVLHIADMGYYGVSIEPVVTTGPRAICEQHLDTVFKEYDVLAQEYVRRRKFGNGFAFFHFMVDLDAGPCLAKRIRGCGAGTEYIAVAPGGDIYPCHQFVGRREYKMGSVLEKTISESIASRFDACNIYNIESCKNCWAKYYCSGGCSAANVNINGDMMKPYEIGCAMQRKRLEIAIGIAAKQQMEEL